MKLINQIKKIFKVKTSKFAISGFAHKIIKKDTERLQKNIKKDIFHNLTWNCEICGKERLDKFISVISYPFKGLQGATRNLKYCNDNPKCERLARQRAKTGRI